MEDALVHGAEEGRDKLRKAAVSCKWAIVAADIRMRELTVSNVTVLHNESIVMQGEPGELKHLITRRKRKKNRFWK